MYTSECVDIYHPDMGARSIADFVRMVDFLSDKYVENKGLPNEDHDKSNTFKGDMLEILSEIFFGVYYADPMVGVRDYTPVALSEDYGVDAIGINVVDNQVAVQCKFRSNPSEAITYEDMAKTYAAGRKRHHLALEDDDTLFLITTCNSVSKACKHVFGSQLRLIGRDIISLRIDKNETFWQEAEQRLVATINKLHGQ
jgi:hypothetical protein